MTTTFTRQDLTTVILDLLATGTGKPIGDAQKPPDGGWQGQPNATGSNFIPYVVLTAQTGTISSGTFADPQADWQIPYSLWSFGIRRDQCEAMADLARHVLWVMTGEQYDLGEDTYKVQQVRSDTIGAAVRYDASTDPPYWGEMDTLTVWLTKEN